MASCGGILRDADEICHKGFSRKLGDYVEENVFLAELMAVVTTIDMAVGLGLSQVIVESDSLEVLQLLEVRNVSTHQ